MALKLSKAQLDHISTYIRQELQKIGSDAQQAAIDAAVNKFMRTKEGKMIAHLRSKLKGQRGCSCFGDEFTEGIRKAAMERHQKPFHGMYLSLDDIAQQVSVRCLDMDSGADVIEAVKRHYYAKLDPKVRKKFGLDVKPAEKVVVKVSNAKH